VEPYLKAGRYKADHLQWAADMQVELEAECGEILESVPQVPFAAAGLRHGFHSPVSGAPLMLQEESDGYYLDPTTGELLTSWTQRRAHTLLAHWRVLLLMRSFAVQSQLRRDDRYMAWPLAGLRLLHDYVEFFRRVRPWKREPYEPLYGSVSEDAGLLIVLANFHGIAQGMESYTEDKQATALVVAQGLAASLLRAIEEVEALTPLERVYVTTALIVAGRSCDQPTWTATAEAASGGLRGLLASCLSRTADGGTDGFLRGGSMLDHLAAMPALLALYIDSQLEDDAVDLEMLLLMQAPLALADHDLALPVIGRYGTPGSFRLTAMLDVYELAATQLDADIYGPVLAAIVEHNQGHRGLWSIPLGLDLLPAADGLAEGPSILTANQTLVLRGGPETPTVLFLAGQADGPAAHEHVGGVFIRAMGQAVSPDPGDPGVKMDPIVSQYLGSFLAHNTLILGESLFPGEPELLWLAETEPPQAVLRLAAGDAGDEVERRVIHDGDLVIVADVFTLTAERVAGTVWRAMGDLSVLSHETVAEATTRTAGGLGPAPDEGPWRALTEHRHLHLEPAELLRLRWACGPELWLDATCLSDAAGELLIAQAPSCPPVQSQSVAVRRSRAASWLAITIFDVHQGEPRVVNAEWAEEVRQLTVMLADGDCRFYALEPTDFG